MTALALTKTYGHEIAYREQSAAASSSAYTVWEMLIKAAEHARNNANDWRSLTKALIEEVAVECRTPNWDGYGANPISPQAKRYAQQLIDSLPYKFPVPDPVPEADGDFSLTWDFAPGHIFTVSVNPSGMLSYAGLLGEGITRHGMEPFKGSIPKVILDSIGELCDRANPTA